MRAFVAAPVALGALVAGYLWGYGVGEREGLDSDPESTEVCGVATLKVGGTWYGCERPVGHVGFHSRQVPVGGDG